MDKSLLLEICYSIKRFPKLITSLISAGKGWPTIYIQAPTCSKWPQISSQLAQMPPLLLYDSFSSKRWCIWKWEMHTSALLCVTVLAHGSVIGKIELIQLPQSCSASCIGHREFLNKSLHVFCLLESSFLCCRMEPGTAARHPQPTPCYCTQGPRWQPEVSFFPLPPRSAPMMPGRGAWRRCRRRKWRKALESGLGEAEVAEVDGGGGSERRWTTNSTRESAAWPRPCPRLPSAMSHGAAHSPFPPARPGPAPWREASRWDGPAFWPRFSLGFSCPRQGVGQAGSPEACGGWWLPRLAQAVESQGKGQKAAVGSLRLLPADLGVHAVGFFFCSGPLVRYRVLEFILCLVLHVPEEPVCAVKCRFLTTRGTASRRSV